VSLRSIIFIKLRDYRLVGAVFACIPLLFSGITAIKMVLYHFISWLTRLKNSGMQAHATPTSIDSTVFIINQPWMLYFPGPIHWGTK